MTPAMLRAMRGAVDWSMRDLAHAAGISLATVLKVEQGGGVTATTERKLRGAFVSMGVTARREGAGGTVTIRQRPSPVRPGVPAQLHGLPYVVVRPRADGTHRVLFEVPARARPTGWPACRPLPLVYPRAGDLTDPDEVAAIRVDAGKLLKDLGSARRRRTQEGLSTPVPQK